MRSTKSVLFVLLLLGPRLLAQISTVEQSLDPYAWTIETYPFPMYALEIGFISKTRGTLQPPPFPGEGAGAKELRKFIRESSDVVTHFLEEEGLALPEGSLVVFDSESMTLAARLPQIAHRELRFCTESIAQNVPKYLVFDHQLVEAPASEMRRLLAEHGSSADHTQFLRFLEDGPGKILSTSRIETRSGQRAILFRREVHLAATELPVDDDGTDHHLTKMLPSGTSIELDAVLGEDRLNIDLHFILDHHYAPVEKRVHPQTHGGDKPVSLGLVDSWNARLSTAITMRAGHSKLLGLWHPTRNKGGRERDVLQASFLRADVVYVRPPLNPALAKVLNDHGDAVVAVPELIHEAEKIPEGLIVRHFRVPSDFLSYLDHAESADALGDDPFAPPGPDPRSLLRPPLKEIFLSLGVEFPEGSAISYQPERDSLEVRNTPENIDLMEAILTYGGPDTPAMIVLTTHVVEAPAPLLRQAAHDCRGLANHEVIWELLLKRDAKVVSTHLTHTRSGQRTKVESGRLYQHLARANLGNSGATKLTPGGGNPLSTVQVESTRVGTILEVDPVLGEDGTLIDLGFSLSHDYAPPRLDGAIPDADEEKIEGDALGPVFHKSQVTTAATMRNGSIRMMGMWETGEQDRAQAVFLRAERVQILKPDP